MTGRGAQWVGPLCAVLGVLGFSFKAIIIKLAYSWHDVDPVTLLTLRMRYRVSTHFNWYAGRVADFLVGDFGEVILRFYAQRAEAPAAAAQPEAGS